MEDIAIRNEENRVGLEAFAVIRIFLGIVWLFEALRGVPWAIPAAVPGILLLIGLFTPLAALAGLVLTYLVYQQASSPQAWGTWPWLYWLIGLMHVVVFFTAAGRVWGVDAFSARRKPLWPLW